MVKSEAGEIREMDLWDGVDAVLVINLDDRPERWAQLLAEADGFIPEGKIHRISGVRGTRMLGYGKKPWFRGKSRDATWAARGGCVLAHRRAFEAARDAGWDTVLILEDDVTFTQTLRDKCQPLGLALATGKWDLCYLGYTDPSPPWSKLAYYSSDGFLARVFGCNCAHAYIVKSGLRDWILKNMPDQARIWPWLARHRAVDRWYLRTIGRHFRVAATSSSLINQAAGYSDIVAKETNYLAQGIHVTAIPKDAPTSHPIFANWLRCQRYRFELIYDFLRALIKRARGF